MYFAHPAMNTPPTLVVRPPMRSYTHSAHFPFSDPIAPTHDVILPYLREDSQFLQYFAILSINISPIPKITLGLDSDVKVLPYWVSRSMMSPFSVIVPIRPLKSAKTLSWSNISRFSQSFRKIGARSRSDLTAALILHGIALAK